MSVAFTLNGTSVEGRSGETLLQSAKRHGIEIPHLCYTDGMRADGNCRACMVEVKGETYTHLLSTPFASKVENEMLDQSARQIQASGGRPIVWVFSEEEAAQKMRKVFDAAGEGRQKIIIVYIPWARSNP